MEEIKGYVEHIVYRNEDNGYTVFNLNNDDGDLTCVGKFHYIEEGELLELTGEYIVHKVYGTQLQVETSKVCQPEDKVSIERYLGSGAIKGVGPSLAGRIVKKFGGDTFRIIEEEPERLIFVPVQRNSLPMKPFFTRLRCSRRSSSCRRLVRYISSSSLAKILATLKS